MIKEQALFRKVTRQRKRALNFPGANCGVGKYLEKAMVDTGWISSVCCIDFSGLIRVKSGLQ